MPRPDSHSPWIDGSEELGASRARTGVVKFGLISRKGLALIVAAVLGVAWLSEREPGSDDTRRQVLPGESGGGSVSIAVSPDGKRIATTEFRGHLALWHAEDGWWSENLIALGGYANTAVFSPDGRYLAAGGKRLALWELGSRGATRVAQLPVPEVQALAFSPDSKTLAVTLEHSGDVILWDMVEGRQRATLPSPGPSNLSIAFSPDGRYLAAGANGRIASFSVWKVATGECTLKINGNFGAIRSLAFSRDGTSIATTGAFESCVRLWEVRSGRLLRSIAGHHMGTNSIAFSPNGTILATVGNDGMGRLWSTATGELLTILDGQSTSLRSVAFTPDGRTLAATAMGDNDVRLWDVTAS
jgi:WD40 repeat protein